MSKGPVDAQALSDRYVALRRLASRLADTVTVREVCLVIDGDAAPAVGARTTAVAFTEPGSGRVLRFDPAIATGRADRWMDLLPEAPLLFADALRSGELVEVADPDAVAHALAGDGHGNVRVTVHPTASGPDLPGIAIAFAWDGPGATGDDADIAAVVALCNSAVRRAWVTRRAHLLAAVTDALIRTAPVGFAVLDRDLRYLHINETLAAFAGKPPEAHVGRSLRDMVPSVADMAESVLREVIETGRSTERVEIPWVSPGRPAGGNTWQVMCFPVTDVSGAAIGAGVIVEDVTEARDTRRELERLYDREREVAARLQEGLQPDRIVTPAGYDVAARYLSGTDDLRLGGDWHDLFELGPDRMAIVCGDAVGHGLDAALTMVRIRHALAGLSHAVGDPGSALDRLDQFVAVEHDRYAATLFYGVMEPSTGRITFSSAGHPPPLVVSAGGAVAAVNEGRATPLGITGSARPSAVLALEPGDTLVLYTDGLYEQRGDSAGAGMARLLEEAARPVEDVEAFADHLLDAVPSAERPDDIALIVLRRREG
jgi:serine phosphatase RsbU (regulator of sigma subunit)/PAS domain-containing protein